MSTGDRVLAIPRRIAATLLWRLLPDWARLLGRTDRVEAHQRDLLGRTDRIESYQRDLLAFAQDLQRVAADHEARLNEQRFAIDDQRRGTDEAIRLSARLARSVGMLHTREVGSLALPPEAKGPPTLLIDLRITQIAQRERGIVRYSTALALALADRRSAGTVAFLIDPDETPPDEIAAFRARGTVVEGPAAIARLPRVTHFLQSCLFDLSKSAQDLFPAELARFRPRLSAVAYDLIPWIYPDRYLVDDYARERYGYLFDLCAHVDHHFAISEQTRQDMIAIAGVPGDRVTTVHGGVDEARWGPFRDEPLPDGPPTVANTAGDTFVLDRPYWLYVGGGDFRKNIPGLVEAFARLLADVPGPRPMLVIACSLSAEVRAGVTEQAAALGLVVGEDLVMTGFVDDATLARCYRRAFATVFPSLYEGLGLPVLESYYFGVPAIASGTTSLAEITAPDCRFDPTSAQDIARAMRDLHADPAKRAASVDHGRAVLGFCDWGRVADAIGAYMDRED